MLIKLYLHNSLFCHKLGNTSKYIGEDEAELGTNVTHKWLVYVSTKTSVPIEDIVCRARFFLHESYKPNDIIEVK